MHDQSQQKRRLGLMSLFIKKELYQLLFLRAQWVSGNKDFRDGLAQADQLSG